MAEAPDSSIAEIAEPIHRLSVAQYRRMAEAGVLGPDDDVELLEGVLVDKVTKNPPHRIATHRTRSALERMVPDGWYVDSQEPIETGDSEPEPDVAVIRGATEDYLDGHPPASAVALVVEIADATLQRDRILKARVYARAGIPTYCLLDLLADQLEVFTDPAGQGGAAAYRSHQVLGPNDCVPVVLDGRSVGELRVADLLPPRR